MLQRITHITGILACIVLIIACFLPWTHYTSINETFTGFNVRRFPSGIYYGKAGWIVAILATLILLFMLIPKLWAKRTNLFLAALLLAYTIRTYILFTSAMFKGEVDKKVGMYLVLLMPIIILVCSILPKYDVNPKNVKP